MDDNGYMRTEDYTDWESVDEEVEPEPHGQGTTYQNHCMQKWRRNRGRAAAKK